MNRIQVVGEILVLIGLDGFDDVGIALLVAFRQVAEHGDAQDFEAGTVRLAGDVGIAAVIGEVDHSVEVEGYPGRSRKSATGPSPYRGRYCRNRLPG